MKDFQRQLEHMQQIYSLTNNNTPKQKTILDIFNKTYHEDYISDYLAFILDPSHNGMGVLPLRSLVECSGGIWKKEYEEKIEIHREYTLTNQRRIDFFIKLSESFVIGIEHKVYSSEHNAQTINYANQIKTTYAECDHLFLFISPNGIKPLSPDFTAISYRDLLAAFKQVPIGVADGLRSVALFQDFIDHLEENFVENESLILSEKSKLYLEHANMIDDIKDTFMAEHDSIVKNITNIGKNALETVGTDDWQVERKKTYQQLYKDNWKHNDYFIHFEMNISVETMMNRSPVLWMLDIEGSLKQDIRDMLEFSIKDYGFTLINNSRTIFRLEIDIFDDEGNISQAQIHKNIESCVDKCQPLIKDIDNLVASYDDSQLVK